jgi:hypothetical protein
VFDKQETGGQWSSVETKFHINYLEMKAILLGLQFLCNNAHDTHICVQSDNTTAVSYINAMGVSSQKTVMTWLYKFGNGAYPNKFG